MDADAYTTELFGYQRRCLLRMRSLEDAHGVTTPDTHVDTRVGLLTDPPGAGKTRVIIALITSDGDPPALPPPIYTDVVIPPLIRVNRTREPATGVACSNTTLVIVSQSLVAQWEREMRRSAACNESMIVVRVMKDVTKLTSMIRPQNADLPPEIPRVILTAVRRYSALNALFIQASVRFRRVVVDEAMHMHDASIGRMPATAFTWLISAASEEATCREIVPPRSHAFWSSLSMLPTEALRLITVRTPNVDIVYPGSVQMRYYTCELDTALAFAARSLVSDQVRALLEANDIHSAIAAMGGSAEEDLMTVVRRRIQHDLQLATLERSRLVLMNGATGRFDANIARLDAREERLRRDAENAEDRFSTALTADCPICHDTIDVPVLLTCCQTLFCAECILTWWTHAHATLRACPACRSSDFRIEKIATDSTQPHARVIGPLQERRPTKADEVVRIVAGARGGVMVYSCHLTGLRRSICALREAGHTTEEIKGQSTTRDKRLRDFASGAVKVLALDATLNCAGIDLQSLTDIIMYHDMPDSVKEQIIGRGHRINRTGVLTVHCLWEAAGTA
jgi:hypothetical protein